MTTYTSTQLASMAARNEKRARAFIDSAIHRDPTISKQTARLIAATLHAGPYTALGRFAACGAFDAARLRDELDRIGSDQIRRPWRRAMTTYITEAHRGTA